jgi:hypothetical protein
MKTSATRQGSAVAVDVVVTDEALTVELSDGRTLSVPLNWFPRLVNGTDTERRNWRLAGRGQGIHWEQLDEDISVEGLIAGDPSGESASSFKRWLDGREQRSETRVAETPLKSNR